MKLPVENRVLTYTTVLTVLLLFFWILSLRRRPAEGPLEARMEGSRREPADQRGCTVDTCLKLDRCLLDLDGIHVYVQPLVKLRNEKGELINLPVSREFAAIRRAISSSRFNVDDPRHACFVLPGVDLLNLRAFRTNDEIQRVIEAVERLLPADSNLLLFNSILARSMNDHPLHLRHVWASAALDHSSLRRRFDIAIPMLRPYVLDTNQTETETNFPADRIQVAVVLRFAGETVSQRVHEALKPMNRAANRTVVYLHETPETEHRVNVVRDESGAERNYAEVLSRSAFTIIHDLVPGFQMVLLDAMESGSIPVIVSDDFLPPFHEVLDWSRFSLRIAKQNLAQLARILQSIPPAQVNEMRLNARRVFARFLADPQKTALATLHVLERRILPVESAEFDEWASDSADHQKLWTNVPIRSLASNLSVILAVRPDEEALKRAVSALRSTIPAEQLSSVFVLWPTASRPTGLESLAEQLERPHGQKGRVSVRLLNWDAADIPAHLADFSASLEHRAEISHGCWLFVDLRTADPLRPLSPDLFRQAFGAWKENADAVLTFEPSVRPTDVVEDSHRTAPFFQGVSFVHPEALRELDEADGRPPRCSPVALRPTECSARKADDEAECAEFRMQLCRPAVL